MAHPIKESNQGLRSCKTLHTRETDVLWQFHSTFTTAVHYILSL